MTTSGDSKSRVIWSCLILLCFVAAWAIPYFEGRSNSVWVIPLPAFLIPMLVLFVSAVVQFWRCLRSILSKRPDWMPAAVLFLLSLLLCFFSIGIPRAAIFHWGFHRYAKTVLTAAEWRSIAQLAQTRLQPGHGLAGPGKKSLWNPAKHSSLWSEFSTTTRIGQLDRSLTISVRPEYTQIAWGGALVGHRGVIVFTGKPEMPWRGQKSWSNFFADDMATFITSN